jgi:hypothetical protein
MSFNDKIHSYSSKFKTYKRIPSEKSPPTLNSPQVTFIRQPASTSFQRWRIKLILQKSEMQGNENKFQNPGALRGRVAFVAGDRTEG